MSEIPAYPAPARALTDSDVVLGFVGKTSAVPMSALASYLEETLPAAADSAEVQALQVTSSYAYPTGSVKKEALFEALDAAGRLADLLQNIPAPLNNDGSVNEAGWRLLHAQTFMATDAAGAYIQSLYYPSDPAGFAALFSSAGSGSTTPSTITVAPVVQSSGTSDTQVMSQGTVTALAATKPDLAPATPYSPLAIGAAQRLQAWNDKFYNSTSGHIIPTDGSGDYLNGQITPSAAQPAMWQMWQGFNAGIYEPWKIATAAGNTASAAALVAQATAHWTYIKSCFSAANLQTGNGGIVNLSDDGAWHARGLTQIHEMLGDTTALGYAVELIPYITNRFHDPLQTGTDYISYGVSTPALGTAFKSDRWGILYAAASDTASIKAYGYVSSTYEAWLAYSALYLSQQTAVSSALRTAFLSYAQNVFNWALANMRTPAPASSAKTAQGVYACNFNLDPNVNANNNSSVNGGAAQTGAYDPNQAYHQPQNAYFGKPIRGLTYAYDGGTLMVGTLAGKLYAVTGTASYAAEAVSISNAYALTNAFGRVKDGLPYIGNLRDPWTNGNPWPEFMRQCSGLAGFDSTKLLRQALVNTARKILASSFDGYLSANWAGAETNFVDGTSTWDDTSAVQSLGGGGQAKPQQIMTSSTSLSVVQAALQVTDALILLTSGVSANAAIEMLPALLSSLRMATEETLSRSGGIATGRIGAFDSQFYLGLDASGNPYLNFGDGDMITYRRDIFRFEFAIGHVKVGTLDGNGAMQIKGALTQNVSIT